MSTPQEGTKKVKPEDIIVGDHRKDPGDIPSLANSIKTHGLINPIIVDADLHLIAGWRRLKAVISLRWQEVEVRLYESLTPFERKEVELEEEIAQKKSRTWQEEVEIKRKLHELFMLEKGATTTKRKGSHGTKSWTQKDTAERIGVPLSSLSEDMRLAEALKHFPDLANATTKKDALRKMYAMRELAILQRLATIGKGGDEDDIEFLCGDAYSLMKEVPDSSFDCCITDPPWGIEIERAGSARSNDYIEFQDTEDVWRKFLKKGLPEIFRILKEGAHFWLFFGPEFYQITREAVEKVGFDIRYVPCIWVKEKPNYTDVEYKPMPQYESFFFALKPAHNEKGELTAPRRLNEATSDVFTYHRNTVGRIHRTEKPVDFMKRLISLSTMKGDRVFDPFAGSAAVLCAAFLARRKALGFELDKTIYEAANGRLMHLRADVEAELEAQDELEEEEKKKKSA